MGSVKITFLTPEKAISPGQVAVVYDESGEWCMGGGIIENTERMAEQLLG